MHVTGKPNQTSCRVSSYGEKILCRVDSLNFVSFRSFHLRKAGPWASESGKKNTVIHSRTQVNRTEGRFHIPGLLVNIGPMCCFAKSGILAFRRRKICQYEHKSDDDSTEGRFSSHQGFLLSVGILAPILVCPGAKKKESLNKGGTNCLACHHYFPDKSQAYQPNPTTDYY